MQKGLATIWIIIGIVLLAVTSGAYYFGYDHGFEKSTKSPTVPSMDSQTSQPVALPSSGGEFKQINISNKWVKYRPACKPLVNSIEIYYPENWFPKDFPWDDMQVCYVLIGYPVEPTGHQDTAPNQLVEFRIHAFLKREQTFDQYIDTIKKQEPKPLKVSKIMINNKEFTRFDFEKKCCADASVFYTSMGDVFLRMRAASSYGYPSNPQPSELDPVVIESLNNEFLKRIILF